MSEDFDIRLERKLESKAAGAGGGVSEVRRIELITGIGRRRRWSREDKARIVVESLTGGVSVSEVARRHGLSPQQLFAWRREARALLHEGGAQHRGMGLLQIRHRGHVVAKAGQSPHPRSVTTRQRLHRW